MQHNKNMHKRFKLPKNQHVSLDISHGFILNVYNERNNNPETNSATIVMYAENVYIHISSETSNTLLFLNITLQTQI